MRSLRVDQTARNRDEWPNLSDLDEPTRRPTFADGEPVGPLEHIDEPPSRTRIILALAFIIGALLVKACLPAYVDAGEPTSVLVD